MKKLLLLALAALCLCAGDFDRRGRSPASFDPSSLKGMTMWLDASDLMTLGYENLKMESNTFDDGGDWVLDQLTVAQDVDSPLGSGTGWTFTASAGNNDHRIYDQAANRPTLVAGVPYRNSVYLKTGTHDNVWFGYNTATHDGLTFETSTGTILSTNAGNGTYDAVAFTNRTSSIDVFTGWHDGVNISGQLNGGAITSTASGNTAAVSGALIIGDDAGQTPHGTLYEMLTYNRKLPSAERAQVTKYLQAKWGAR